MKMKEFKSNFYDIIIIGAGPAGITLANALNKNFKIALIEAGLDIYSPKHQETYTGEIVGEFPREQHISRLKMFGGTTGHWGGTCRPLDDYDFDKWPIFKKDLNPYLKNASDILEIKNEFREINLPRSENIKLIEFQVSKVKFGSKYLKKINESNNIDLFLDTSFIEMDGKNRYFEKILIKFEGEKKIIFGKNIVLAAGGIENSRILLLENNNKNRLFDKNLPIGKYWFEHPFKELGEGITNEKQISQKLNNNFNQFVNMFSTSDNSLTYSLAPTEKFIKEKQILNSCIWIVLHRRSYRNWKNTAKNLLCIQPELSKTLLQLIDKKLSCGSTLYSSWEQEPEENNMIALSEKLFDEYGKQLSKIIYQKSKLVRNTARIFMEEIAKYYIQENLGRISINSFLINDKEKYISEAGWHHMGGTRMGYNSNSAVVDKNLKLFGSKNIYIVGSSVFPTGGHANPTLTIIQLSLRLADYLNKNYN